MQQAGSVMLRRAINNKSSGYILISMMALMMILSASLLASAQQGALALKHSLLLRDRFQVEAYTDAALHAAEQVILQLDFPLAPTEMNACKTPCVLTRHESSFFLEQGLVWWLAEGNPVPVRLNISSAHIKAYLVLEHLTTQDNPQTLQKLEYFRGTLILTHTWQQVILRLQVYFERASPQNYQQSANGLATLKGGINKVRRLALRRG